MSVETRTECRVPRLLTGNDRARIFRGCLEVLAEPGQIRDIRAIFAGRDRAPAGCSIMAAPLLVLSDLVTPLAAMPGDAAAAAEVMVIAALTHAPIVGYGTARMVLALRPPARDDLLGLHRGTAGEPQTAALLCLAVDSLGTGRGALRLAGPGVRGTRELRLDGLAGDLLAARAEALEFPLGFDVLLVDPEGRVAGLPRTTRVEVVP